MDSKQVFYVSRSTLYLEPIENGQFFLRMLYKAVGAVPDA